MGAVYVIILNYNTPGIWAVTKELNYLLSNPLEKNFYDI